MMELLDEPQCKQKILARLARVRRDSPRRWGKMSAPQMICHLNDTFRGVIGERPTQIAPGYFARKVIMWVALYVPIPWPKGVPTRPEFDQQVGGTPPAEFEGDVAQLCHVIERFTERPRSFQFQPHPIFLEMSEKDWMRWGYLHMDHHLRQFGV
jgi:Protein of unknown function (DUF1569)